MINRFILNAVSYFGPGAREVLPKEIIRLGLHKAFVTTDKDLIKYGVVHGMAHPLGAIFDIPHGVANALLLPVIMEFYAPAALDKYVDIAKAMNVYTSGMSREDAVRVAVEAVKSLAMRVGIPQYLSELGIEEDDLERLSEAAFTDVCTPGNPREVSKEIIIVIKRE